VPSEKDLIDEPDRLPGAPRPREQFSLFGHSQAEAALLEAFQNDRLHHAWLIGGLRGIGKATLAYRFARFLLANPPGTGEGAISLAIGPNHPVSRQVAALSHPNLVALRRLHAPDKKAASTTIPVDAVRRAMSLFESTAADGGYRICIVDSAEDLTGSSANALLKLIEEPPSRSLFLIVAHAPQSVLATVRSRCRRLILKPLSNDDVRKALHSLGTMEPDSNGEAFERAVSLAEGSVARAIEMLDPERVAVVAEVTSVLAGFERLDWKRVLALAEKLARRDSDELYAIALDTVVCWASDQIHSRASEGPSRLAGLAEVCEKISRAALDADAYNLDRRPVIISMMGDLAEAARRI
jgi:DNA polymerase-3 subunit delta'